MSVIIASLTGAIAGLIVSSWQGFKDPPWEGFSVQKFLRSNIQNAKGKAKTYQVKRYCGL